MLLRRLLSRNSLRARPTSTILHSETPSSLQQQCRLLPLPPLPTAPQLRSYAAGGKVTLNEAIPATEVQYIDAGGKYHGVQSLRRLLSEIDRNTYHIMCMNVQATPPLVCKLISKADLEAKRVQQYQEKKKRKTQPIVQKEIELSWAISQHDLGHRLRKMEEFLRKGNRVTIMLGVKKGMQKQTLASMTELAKQIAMEAEKYGKELQEPEGSIGRKYTMFYEGTPPKEDKSTA